MAHDTTTTTAPAARAVAPREHVWGAAAAATTAWLVVRLLAEARGWSAPTPPPGAALQSVLGEVGPTLTASIGLACLVVTAVALQRIVVRAGGSPLGAAAAVAVVLVNIAVVTPFTLTWQVPVLVTAAVLTVSGLVGWASSPTPYSGGELAVFCGLPALVAVLAGAPGWLLWVLCTAVVGVVAQRRWHHRRYSLRCARSFTILPALAAAWWAWRSWLDGDPLGASTSLDWWWTAPVQVGATVPLGLVLVAPVVGVAIGLAVGALVPHGATRGHGPGSDTDDDAEAVEVTA